MDMNGYEHDCRIYEVMYQQDVMNLDVPELS